MRIRKCEKCEKYTFKEICPLCGSLTSNPEPPTYSPSDKYGYFRRKLIKELEEKGSE